VGAAFLIVSGIDKRCADKPIGVSLWRPDLDWLDPKSGGESIESLPAKLWVLGLGHLGQAYLWAMSFLPYTESSTPLIMLQDDDDIVEANYGAGLLTEEKHVGQKKTRRCATWLEDLHYTTLITERKFDSITKRSDGEPFIAVCGFDNAQSRIHLENAGFDLVVECGIGGKLDSFDDFTIHTFPGTARTPAQLWGAPSEAEVNKSILKEIKAIEEEKCGALYDALSKKAISTAFVGMLAGAFVIAEVVRAANCGTRYEQVNFQLRCQKYMGAYIMGTYSTEAARNGVLPVNYEASPYVEPLD
jgi:hypothetical protein